MARKWLRDPSEKNDLGLLLLLLRHDERILISICGALTNHTVWWEGAAFLQFLTKKEVPHEPCPPPPLIIGKRKGRFVSGFNYAFAFDSDSVAFPISVRASSLRDEFICHTSIEDAHVVKWHAAPEVGRYYIVGKSADNKSLFCQ